MKKRTRACVWRLMLLSGILYLVYRSLTPSQQQRVREMARQIPFLIPRYLV